MTLLEQSEIGQQIAPDLVLSEFLNAGWKTRRAGGITDAQRQAMATLAPQPLGEVVPSDHRLLQGAVAWCTRLDHPAYDCLDLALAEQRQATLITADQRLLGNLERKQPGTGLAMDLARWPDG